MNIFVDINETINIGDLICGKNVNDVLVNKVDTMIFLNIKNKEKNIKELLKKVKGDKKIKLRNKLLESHKSILKFYDKEIILSKKKYNLFISKLIKKIKKINKPYISKKYNFLVKSWFNLLTKYYSNNLIMINTFGPESQVVIKISKLINKKLIKNNSRYFIINYNYHYNDYKKGLIEFHKKVDNKYIYKVNLYQEFNKFKINKKELTNYFNHLCRLSGIHSTRQSYRCWNENISKIGYGKVIPIDGKKLTIFFDDHVEINKDDNYTNIQLLENGKWYQFQLKMVCQFTIISKLLESVLVSIKLH